MTPEHSTARTGILRSFAGLGLVIGTLFFAASLTPSLIPRSPLIQGVLSGLCLAAGYGVGVLLQYLWDSLKLRMPSPRPRRIGRTIALAVSVLIAVLALWKASAWQDSVLMLMEMPPSDGARPFKVAALALAVFVPLLLIGRAFRILTRKLADKFSRRIPTPVATLAGLFVTAWLFYSIGNGVLVRGAMGAFDASFSKLDALLEETSPQPTDALKTGGPGSLLTWEDLGRAGREAVSAAPDREKIAAMTGGPALEPLRIYVGLNSAPSVEERAQLALQEMIRVGAFERANVVIVTPTGTGWVDPESQPALEYVLRGDVASVTVQYSYLASWLALMADPEYGASTARAVFAAVYGHWRGLPKDTRPKLYLHGLSLGSFNSDLSHDLYQVIGDPYHGAFWSGPPFPSRTWRDVTARRNPGTPAWLPEFRDGSVIRFTAQHNHLAEATAPWGPFRIIYLQYASDPITFFETDALWRKPEWMKAPLGPDVSPELVWIPVVTFLQLAVDMMLATTTPRGYGHVFAFDHYLDGWASLTDAPGWTPEELEALKAKVEAERP
jgi:uncharacterized membrane protein